MLQTQTYPRNPFPSPLCACSGRFPPMMHRQLAPEGRGQRAASSSFSRSHNNEAVAKAKGAGTGAGAGGKSNLAGQIIPVYGFGILLYILYILFKVKQLVCLLQDGAIDHSIEADVGLAVSKSQSCLDRSLINETSPKH